MAVWNGSPAATLGAAAQPCHLRVQAAFVDEDQLARIEIGCVSNQSARGQDVVALLLRGVRIHVMPRLKNLEISD